MGWIGQCCGSGKRRAKERESFVGRRRRLCLPARVRGRETPSVVVLPQLRPSRGPRRTFVPSSPRAHTRDRACARPLPTRSRTAKLESNFLSYRECLTSFSPELECIPSSLVSLLVWSFPNYTASAPSMPWLASPRSCPPVHDQPWVVEMEERCPKLSPFLFSLFLFTSLFYPCLCLSMCFRGCDVNLPPAHLAREPLRGEYELGGYRCLGSLMCATCYMMYMPVFLSFSLPVDVNVERRL